MKKLQHFILAIFSLLALFACRPMADENGELLNGLKGNGTGNGTGSGSGTGTSGTLYLSKFTTYDDNDTPYSYNFVYTNKLVSKITTSDNSYTSDISYNNGKISKVISVVKDDQTSEVTTITSNVSYNSAGYIAKVDATEVLSLGGTVINTTNKLSTYTYNSGNQVSKVVQDYTIAGQPTQSGIIDYYYSGKNLSKSVVTTKITGSPIPDITATMEFSNYDNKISPFSTLGSNYNTFSLAEVGLGYFGSPNNFTKMSVTESWLGTNITTNIAYEYNSQNYAISLTPEGEKKSTFVYTSL